MLDPEKLPALDEAEIRARGAADRLEGQGFLGELSPSEIVNGTDDLDVQKTIEQRFEKADVDERRRRQRERMEDRRRSLVDNVDLNHATISNG